MEYIILFYDTSGTTRKRRSLDLEDIDITRLLRRARGPILINSGFARQNDIHQEAS